MPNNLVLAVSKKCNVSIDEVEKAWAKAEELAIQQGQKENYEYITSIFKRLIGKECTDKMGWSQQSNQVIPGEGPGAGMRTGVGSGPRMNNQSGRGGARSGMGNQSGMGSRSGRRGNQRRLTDEEETDQMDKMNITAESKIIYQIVDLIAESTK